MPRVRKQSSSNVEQRTCYLSVSGWNLCCCTSFADTHPVYRYPLRAVRGGQVVNRGTVEEPRQTPRNLHYLRLQRSPLCRKWGSLCAPLSFLSPLLLSSSFFLSFFLSFPSFPSFPSFLHAVFVRVPRIRSILRAVCLSERPSTQKRDEEEERWYKEGETLARSFLRLRKFPSNFGGRMKGVTKGLWWRGTRVWFSGGGGWERGKRRDGIMSPRAEPPLARSASRRKEAEKGRGDNGPFKKSLNRELVSSGGPRGSRSLSLSVPRRHASSLRPCLSVPRSSLVAPTGHRELVELSLKPGKPAAIYLSVNAGKFSSLLSRFLNI